MSKLRQWSQETWDDAVIRKTEDMEERNFGSILAELAPEYDSLKPAVETMRQLLLPIEDGVMWTGPTGCE